MLNLLQSPVFFRPIRAREKMQSAPLRDYSDLPLFPGVFAQFICSNPQTFGNFFESISLLLPFRWARWARNVSPASAWWKIDTAVMILSMLQLGRVDYSTALQLQQTLATLRKQQQIGDVLLLLEHPAVLTLGRNAHRENILASDQLLSARGITIFETKRGGDVTYHGPGQLVGYPIIDLRGAFAATPGSAPLGARPDSASPDTVIPRLSAVAYVRRMEEALIRAAADYGVPTQRIAGRTGVWTIAAPGKPERKIAAIGVHISAGVTTHGFAFNLTTPPDDFNLIVPCGIADRGVTSLAEQLPPSHTLPTLDQLGSAIARHFAWALGRQVLALDSLDSLLETASPALSAR
jgi:lipoyl(octanoyl) transferase